MLKITILGSGNFIPYSVNKHSSSHLFQIEKENILFDFGRGAIDGLLNKGLTLDDLNHIFISHTHSDHLAEIGAFLGWATVIFRNEDKKVNIYGPKGIEESLIHIMKAFHVYGNYKKMKDKIIIKELKSGDKVVIGDLSIKGIEVDHDIGWNKMHSLAFRVEYKDKIVCYSGDSPDCPGLREACNNSDLALMECTLPRKEGVRSHISGDELGKLATEENIKKLVVVHVDRDYIKHVKSEIKEFYKGKIILGEDLTQFEIYSM